VLLPAVSANLIFSLADDANGKIDQYRIYIEHRIKGSNSTWTTRTYEDENLVISLNSIPCQMLIADLYDKVDFSVEQE
jgi:hypothetical protein